MSLSSEGLIEDLYVQYSFLDETYQSNKFDLTPSGSLENYQQQIQVQTPILKLDDYILEVLDQT